MIPARTDIQPGNWQITATTMRCDSVDDFVTIMVNRDWSTKCAWFGKYKQRHFENKDRKFNKEIKTKIAKCLGPDCPLAKGYRDKLIKEEFEILKKEGE